MSNLSKVFNAFAAKVQKTFDTKADAELHIGLSFSVQILPSADGRMTVELQADEKHLDKFTVTQKGNAVCLAQNFNTCMRQNDVITIDGVSSKILPRFVIKAPIGTGLQADMGGQAVLLSEIIHRQADISLSGQSVGQVKSTGEAKVDLSGQSSLDLAAAGMKSSVSGQSSLEASLSGGRAVIEASGNSKVALSGAMSDVAAEASGMSDIATSGDVTGSYTASASGMSKIRHSGAISGARNIRSVSGMAKVSI